MNYALESYAYRAILLRMSAKREPFFSFWLPIAIILCFPVLWQQREALIAPTVTSFFFAGGLWLWIRYAHSVDDELNTFRKILITFAGMFAYSTGLISLEAFSRRWLEVSGSDITSGRVTRLLVIAAAMALVSTVFRWNSLRERRPMISIFGSDTSMKH